MIKALILIVSILSCSYCLAGVNLATGQFHQDITDLEINKKNVKFKLWRSYNSQESNVGLFGKGWCSNLEYKIITNKTHHTIYQCNMKKIYFIKNNKKSSYIQGHHLAISKNNSKTYTNLKGDVFYFNKHGALKGLKPYSSQQTVLISKQKKSISLLIGKTKLKLFKRNKLVSSIFNNKKNILKYSYRGKHLVLSKNSQSKFTSYNYNKDSLLSKIIDHKGEFLAIYYNKNKAVYKISQNDFCIENYTYQKNKGLSLSIFIDKSCKDGFTHKNKMLVKYNDLFEILQVTDSYNKNLFAVSPKNRKIVKVKKDGLTKTYAYNHQDTLSTMTVKNSSKQYKANFQYDKNNRISKISYIHPNSKNSSLVLQYGQKNKLRRITSLNHNSYQINYKNNLLSGIKSPSGLLRYNYDSNKKLKTVTLKKGKKVYLHKINTINDKNSDITITNYINSFYTGLGELYTDSDVFQEIL